MAITPLPPAPLPTDTQAQFNTKAFDLVASLGTFVTETNALAGDVSDDAAAAAQSAIDATNNGAAQVLLAQAEAQAAAASAAGAVAAANVTKWGSGTTYAEGAAVWSPISFFTYRRITAGGGTTDPSLDTINWAQVSGTGDVTLNSTQTLTNKTISADNNTLSGIAASSFVLSNASGNIDGSAAQKVIPSGAVVGTTDTQTLTNKTIAFGSNTLTDVASTNTTQTLSNKTLTAPESTGAIYDNGSVRGNVVAVSALNIDCSLGNYFTKTISANSTFTVSNVPASRSYAFTLELTHTSGSVTWFSGVEWPGGAAPTLTNGKTSLFVFVTDDGGTRWRGASLVDYTT